MLHGSYFIRGMFISMKHEGVDIIALIPARSMSKSITNKNIQNFNGLPLFVHSIFLAKKISRVNRIVVSTDSKIYADIARYHGAEVPFLRPRKFSSDLSRDFEFIKHFLDYDENMKQCSAKREQLLVLLRPTHPLRSVEFIQEAINLASMDRSCLVKSLSPATETPYKMWIFNKPHQEQDWVDRVVGSYEDDNHNAPRQILPKTYWQDGIVDILRNCALDKICTKHQKRVSGILSPQKSKEIDYVEDFLHAEKIVKTEKNQELPQVRLLKSDDYERYGS